MIDVLVIGAGIIGSWIALELSKKGLQVAVCEMTANGSDGISGRNSGVLHAGIYYPPGSRKALHCVRGRALSEEFAKKYQVHYEICSKLIVGPDTSTTTQDDMERLYDLSQQNGARGVEIVNNAKSICPYVLSNYALYSKFTGIIDAPAYLKTVRRVAEDQGAIFLWNRKFQGYADSFCELHELDSDHNYRSSEKIEMGVVINAAGLHCANPGVLPGLDDYQIRPVRGEYYRLKKRLPQDILVYPLPSKKSTALGVHYTYHCNGDAYAGPNAIGAKDFNDYAITMPRSEFYNSLKKILDFYNEDDLSPGYAGLRPRLFYKNESVSDFVIQRHSDRIIHLLGIESPGLTSAPSIARHIADMI